MVLTIAFAVPAFAGEKCKAKDVAGSYTRPVSTVGLESVRRFAEFLTLHEDGTVYRYFTLFPEMQQTLGTGTPAVGSWKCTSDKKVLVNIIDATFLPTNVDPYSLEPVEDIALLSHVRRSFLFTVVNDNELNLFQFRRRSYTVTEDPTDPLGGTLGSLGTANVTYTRIQASSDDLNF
jgi:hypothetical protein